MWFKETCAAKMGQTYYKTHFSDLPFQKNELWLAGSRIRNHWVSGTKNTDIQNPAVAEEKL